MTMHDFTTNQAVAVIDQIQAIWQEQDPDFQTVLPFLKIQMAEIGRNYQPAMWPQLMEMNYRLIKLVLQSISESNMAVSEIISKAAGSTLH